MSFDPYPFLVHSPDYYTNRDYLNYKAGVQEQGIPVIFCHIGSKLKRKRMDTIGNLIDKLTIVNIRIWMAEDIKRDKNASDKQIADACMITNIANQLRNDLIQEIDERLGEKSYGQGSTKLYGK